MYDYVSGMNFLFAVTQWNVTNYVSAYFLWSVIIGPRSGDPTAKRSLLVRKSNDMRKAMQCFVYFQHYSSSTALILSDKMVLELNQSKNQQYKILLL